MIDITCIGNALIDGFFTLHEASHYCHVDTEKHELCFPYGGKVPLEAAQFELGGNACNVSVGIARLGLKSSLIAEIGDDAFSHRIQKDLQKEDVNLSHFLVSHAPASFALGIQFKGDRTLFVHHMERSHDFVYEGLQTKWIYLSSMGEKWRHVYREVPAFVKREGVKLAFNPGTRQLEAGEDALAAAMEVTDILFVNKEEGIKISNFKYQMSNTTNEKEEMHKLLISLQKFGPKMVVVTDGKRGATVLDAEGKFYHQGISDDPVVERTGAGDAFATGFMAAIVYEQEIPMALKWGSVNAGSVVGKVGAQPGLLKKEEIERKVDKMAQR